MSKEVSYKSENIKSIYANIYIYIYTTLYNVNYIYS